MKESSPEGRLSEPRLLNVSEIESLPVTSSQLRQATRLDIHLSKALSYTKRGWPNQIGEVLHPLWDRRHELIIEDNHLLWGGRVVVPK